MNSYSLVIPVYNDRDNLRALLDDIYNSLDVNNLQLREIIVVDDASTDGSGEIAKMFESSYFSIKTIRLKRQQGPLAAEQAGIEACSKAPYIIVCHSDLRLVHPIADIRDLPVLKRQARLFQRTGGAEGIPGISSRPLEELIHYLEYFEEASVVAPYVLALEKPVSPRSIANDWVVVDAEHAWDKYLSIPMKRRRFIPLRLVYWERVKEVWSVQSRCYAFRREVWYKTEGFNKFYGPYGFYHDDWFIRCPGKIYLTADVVVYHRYYKEENPGSLAKSTEKIGTQAKQFAKEHKKPIRIHPDGRELKYG